MDSTAVKTQPAETALPMRQIKVMYWGPGESGKTTNFKRLQEIFAKYRISAGYSIATTDERTLWNDAITFQFEIRQLQILLVVMVMTTTGQERFLTTREYVLQNADGIVFVADSDPTKLVDNKRSFQELMAFTKGHNIPIQIQLNKRDLPLAIDEPNFRKAMKLPTMEVDGLGFPIVYEAIAANRRDPGVKACFLDLLQKILKSMAQKS